MYRELNLISWNLTVARDHARLDLMPLQIIELRYSHAWTNRGLNNSNRISRPTINLGTKKNRRNS